MPGPSWASPNGRRSFHTNIGHGLQPGQPFDASGRGGRGSQLKLSEIEGLSFRPGLLGLPPYFPAMFSAMGAAMGTLNNSCWYALIINNIHNTNPIKPINVFNPQKIP